MGTQERSLALCIPLPALSALGKYAGARYGAVTFYFPSSQLTHRTVRAAAQLTATLGGQHGQHLADFAAMLSSMLLPPHLPAALPEAVAYDDSDDDSEGGDDGRHGFNDEASDAEDGPARSRHAMHAVTLEFFDKRTERSFQSWSAQLLCMVSAIAWPASGLYGPSLNCVTRVLSLPHL